MKIALIILASLAVLVLIVFHIIVKVIDSVIDFETDYYYEEIDDEEY
jgi:hypothetical protein